jgi:hypothetical protein
MAYIAARGSAAAEESAPDGTQDDGDYQEEPVPQGTQDDDSDQEDPRPSIGTSSTVIPGVSKTVYNSKVQHGSTANWLMNVCCCANQFDPLMCPDVP